MRKDIPGTHEQKRIIEIVPATGADTKELLELQFAISEEDYLKHCGGIDTRPRDTIEGEFRGKLRAAIDNHLKDWERFFDKTENVYTKYWVAKEGDRIVGFAIARIKGGKNDHQNNELLGMGISPDARRLGIAQELFKKRVEWIIKRNKELGVTDSIIIHAETYYGNNALVGALNKFVRENGYVITKNYMKEGDPLNGEIIMRLPKQVIEFRVNVS